MTDVREYRVRVADNVELSVEEQGDRHGRAVLLLHGYGDSARAYRPFARALPAAWRIVAPTLRGHGDSSKPDAAYDTAAFAGDIVALLDRLGIAQACLVGHSMGSLVAQRLAIDHPGRVTAMTLIGAFSTVRGHADLVQFARDTIEPLTDPVDPTFARDFQAGTLARPVAADFLDGVVAESLKVPARVWRAALRAMLAEDRSALLPRIAAPTLVIWGDRDTYCGRADQEKLATRIPDARLSVHHGAGHDPHWEDPARCAAEVAAWFRRTRAAAA